MGVTIEQYRARIGAHNSFVKAKGNLLCENIFLNTTSLNLIVLLTRGVYLIGYIVYIALLLRMANDVEENPGPTVYEIIDPTKTICADFSQGNRRQFGQNAGKQCVAMSLTAIVHTQVKAITTWDTSFLNTILSVGNNLYTYITTSINKDLLLLTEIPEMISIDNRIINLQYSDSFSGDVFMTLDNAPFYSLQTAINKIFLSTELNYQNCLLTIDCNTVAICMIYEGKFKIFDSHSRDLYGVPDPFGKCILIDVEGLDNLPSYFQNTYPQNSRQLLFEIKGVKMLNLDTNIQTNTSFTNNDCELNEQRETKHNENRLTNRRKRAKEARDSESHEHREKRLANRRKQAKEARDSESHEHREKRLANVRKRAKEARDSESHEQRETRLVKMRKRAKQARDNESTKQRENRLANKHKQAKMVIWNESNEHREKRLSQKHKKAKSATGQQNGESQSPISEGLEGTCTTETQNKCLEKIVCQFHDSVSVGPVYVCTCCDQLWYKHSVCRADKIRLLCSNVSKYLQNTISVDNVEWLCNTCMKHLKKEKVPPYAVANGMRFPQKPSFF